MILIMSSFLTRLFSLSLFFFLVNSFFQGSFFLFIYFKFYFDCTGFLLLCVGFLSSCGERGLLFTAVHSLLIVAVSLVAEDGL